MLLAYNQSLNELTWERNGLPPATQVARGPNSLETATQGTVKQITVKMKCGKAAGPLCITAEILL